MATTPCQQNQEDTHSYDWRVPPKESCYISLAEEGKCDIIGMSSYSNIRMFIYDDNDLMLYDTESSKKPEIFGATIKPDYRLVVTNEVTKSTSFSYRAHCNAQVVGTDYTGWIAFGLVCGVYLILLGAILYYFRRREKLAKEVEMSALVESPPAINNDGDEGKPE